jgi:transcription elongation factor GreA
MRELGMLVDGPRRWGDQVPSRKPGVFVVELPATAERAPVDPVAVRRWVERVPGMLVDGEPATAATLARRLETFWLPDEPILFVGRSARAIGGRLGAIYATPLGDARPSSAGHWLKALASLSDLRVWWSETDAHEEYEDALLEAVAARNGGGSAAGAAALPFANLAAAGVGGKEHGIARSLRVDDGSSASPTAKTAPLRRAGATPRTPARPRKPAVARLKDTRPQAQPTFLSREGLDQLTAELEDLRTKVRPQVIARVKAARELGDLRENADYEYARKEQSFVEGRIQTLEHMLRTGTVIEQPPVAEVVHVGSTVEVESEGEYVTYVIVGSTEAKPGSGRLSNESPVGRTLLGARAGDEIVVQIPGGSIAYRVIAVR